MSEFRFVIGLNSQRKSTLGRWDGGKMGGMGLWRGWSPTVAQPFRGGESCWWNPNGSRPPGNEEWAGWGEERQGEKQHEEWWRKEQVWRKSKARSLKTQVSCLERMVGWRQVKMLKLRDKQQEWERNRKEVSSPCTAIAFTFEFRARLSWTLYKWGWGANSRQFYCNTKHNAWLRAN